MIWHLCPVGNHMVPGDFLGTVRAVPPLLGNPVAPIAQLGTVAPVAAAGAREH